MKTIAFSLLLFFTVPIFCMETEKEKGQASETTLLVNSGYPDPAAKSPDQQSSRKWQKRAVQCMKLLGKGIDRFEQIIPYYLAYQSLGLSLRLALEPLPASDGERCEDSYDYDNMFQENTYQDTETNLVLSFLQLLPQACGDGYRLYDQEETQNKEKYLMTNDSTYTLPKQSMFKKCLKTVLRDTIPYALIFWNFYVIHQLSHLPESPSCNPSQHPSGFCETEQEVHEFCNRVLKNTGDILYYSSFAALAVKVSRIRKLIPKRPWRRLFQPSLG